LIRRDALRDLWARAPEGGIRFDPATAPASLRALLAPGVNVPRAVKLVMRGEIRIGRWRSFRATEVIDVERGFVWRAGVGGLIFGADSLVDGAGKLRWAILGVLPVAKASGPDVTRSAIARWLLESIWLPSMLLPENGARWNGSSVSLSRFGEEGTILFELDAKGRPKSLRMRRWGDPANTGTFDDHWFGGTVGEYRCFDGVSIPTRAQVGWHFGTEHWSEGELFRATITEARFR